MIFNRPDGTLGCVDAIVRWFYELLFAIFLLEEGLGRFGAWIVGGVEIDDGACSRRHHWMAVPIVCVPMELMIGRFGRVDAGCSNQVECDCRPLGELIPEL